MMQGWPGWALTTSLVCAPGKGLAQGCCRLRGNVPFESGRNEGFPSVSAISGEIKTSLRPQC